LKCDLGGARELLLERPVANGIGLRKPGSRDESEFLHLRLDVQRIQDFTNVAEEIFAGPPALGTRQPFLQTHAFDG
jgi:hypothetical protein